MYCILGNNTYKKYLFLEVDMDKKLKLFVPGRLCLFGEHSDWASLHRVMNASIIPGHAIVTGVEQ